MFSPEGIYEPLEEIHCLLGREMKEKGWCRLGNWCDGYVECELCDRIFQKEIEAKESGDERRSGDYLYGFLFWKIGMKGSVYDIECMSYNNEWPKFLIEHLPPDLEQYLLRFMLVLDEPITNPHLQNQEWKMRDPQDPEKTLGGIIKYDWCIGLRPMILNTNKRYHSIGTKMLYGYNTFRFTRLVAQAGNLWADLHLVNKGQPDMRPLDQFLTDVHLLFDAGTEDNRMFVNRSTLMRKLTLEDSDLDNDRYAKNGISKVVPSEGPTDRYQHIFYMILRFAKWGTNLHDLVVTLDEEDPAVLSYLQLETSFFQLSCSGKPKCECGEQWESVQKKIKKLLTKNWVFSPSDPKTLPSRGMSVKKIHVRGTDAVGEGKLNFRDPEDGNDDSDGFRISGNYVPTNRIARSFVRLVDTWYRRGYLLERPGISFNGKFDQRRLREDGTFVPDDELDDWLAGKPKRTNNEHGDDEKEEQVKEKQEKDDQVYWMDYTFSNVEQ